MTCALQAVGSRDGLRLMTVVGEASRRAENVPVPKSSAASSWGAIAAIALYGVGFRVDEEYTRPILQIDDGGQACFGGLQLYIAGRYRVIGVGDLQAARTAACVEATTGWLGGEAGVRSPLTTRPRAS